MLEINGVALEFDILDADTAERYEAATKALQKDLSALDLKAISSAEAIRQECQIVFAYFDTIFGAGTAEAIFAGKVNLNRCMDALELLTESSKSQQKKFSERAQKYRPNRAQRRSKL